MKKVILKQKIGNFFDKTSLSRETFVTIAYMRK